MKNPSSSLERVTEWRQLYIAALFETDRSRIPARITEAQEAILIRTREMSSSGHDTIEEDLALEDALYALRALQSCLKVGTLLA